MNNTLDIASFVKDPSLLIDLCRKVIDQLDIGEGRSEICYRTQFSASPDGVNATGTGSSSLRK